MNKRTKLGLAGLAFLAATSAFSPKVNAQEQDKEKTTITVPSQRNVPAIDGRSYVGVPFTYEVLDFYARRADEPKTQFLPRFFYDIDNDGKWGAAEEAMVKKGIPMYMSDDFTQKFLDAYRKQDKEKLLDYTKQIEEFKKKISDLEAKIKTQTKKEKDYRSVYLQAQQTANGDLNSHTTSLGVRLNPFEKVDIGFGANLDLGFGFDEQTDSYTGQLSAGRTVYGTITDTGKFSIGGSLEAQFGPLLIGGGFDYKNWIQNVVEQIKDSSGNVVKSNTNSIPNRQVFGKVYTGVELPVGNAMRLGMIGGYNTKDGVYAGFRVGLKIK